MNGNGIKMHARIALAAGLALLALAIVFALTRSPPAVAWSNGTPLEGTIAYLPGGSQACQGQLTPPAGADAVRVSLYSGIGPRVSVRVLAAGRLLTSGVRGSGWRGESPTIPLRRIAQSARSAELCFVLGSSGESVGLDGIATRGGGGAVARPGGPLGVRLRIEFLRPGGRTWLALVPDVARRLGLGRWPAGTWVALPVAMLMAALLAGATWTLLKELR